MDAQLHGGMADLLLECGVGLEDATLTLVALASIPWSNAAIAVLAELGTRYRVPNMEGALYGGRTAQFGQ
jgi:hypothetical protein